MIQRIILDSWAVIAWLDGVPAGTIVQDLFDVAETHRKMPESLKSLLGRSTTHINLSMSIVNLGEVFYITGRKHGKQKADEVWDEIQAGPIEVLSANESIVYQAANIKMRYRMSYADAFAAATAIVCEAALATGDPELQHFPEIPILWLKH